MPTAARRCPRATSCIDKMSLNEVYSMTEQTDASLLVEAGK